ncbi:hypothetical protein KKA14_20245, partial [bacterium]|nr:hypothetical protein [bacterium]
MDLILYNSDSPLKFKNKNIRFIQVLFFLTLVVSLKTVLAEQIGFELERPFNTQENDLNNHLQIFAEINPSPAAARSIITFSIFGRIDPLYHIYSIHKQGEFSPEPTRLILQTNLLNKIASLSESPTISVMDEAYNQSLNVHKNDFWLKCGFSISEKLTSGTYL